MGTMKEDVKIIISAIGGKDNIKSATHCVTRLRLMLKDQSKVDIPALERNDLVQGTFLAGGQFQIVIGPKVKKVYEEFVAQTGAKEVSKADMKEEVVAKQNWLQRLVRLLGDVFIPIIPAIVASGLLMGLNNVMGNAGIFYSDASFIEMHPAWQGFYDVVNLIAQTSFSFLPVLVGWSAVKKFGGNPLLGIVLGLILVNPALTNAYAYASDPSACPTWNIFGLHVAQCGYQGQVLPVLVASWVLVKIEKFLEKHIPDAVQLILVSPIALLVTGFASFIVIGPVTMAGANFITNSVVALFDAVPVLGGAVYGLICPPLVITGMHHLFLGVNLQMAGSLGYVTLWPVGEPVTIAQGAACLAVAWLYRKNKKKSSIAATSGLSSFMGITEPAIYGVNLRNKYPFIAVMIAGTIGGAWMGFWGVKSTSVGVGGVLSFLSVFPEQWGYYLSGEILIFIITIALTIVLSKTKLNADRDTLSERHGENESTVTVKAVATGKANTLASLEDGVFSAGMVGEGMVIEPTGNTVCAPCDAVVSALMEDSKHAVGLLLANGVEMLIHVGLDTVKMHGEGFEYLVKADQKVKAGEPLMRFSSEKIKAAGYSDKIAVILTAVPENVKMELITDGNVTAGETVLTK